MASPEDPIQDCQDYVAIFKNMFDFLCVWDESKNKSATWICFFWLLFVLCLIPVFYLRTVRNLKKLRTTSSTEEDGANETYCWFSVVIIYVARVMLAYFLVHVLLTMIMILIKDLRPHFDSKFASCTPTEASIFFKGWVNVIYIIRKIARVGINQFHLIIDTVQTFEYLCMYNIMLYQSGKKIDEIVEDQQCSQKKKERCFTMTFRKSELIM